MKRTLQHILSICCILFAQNIYAQELLVSLSPLIDPEEIEISEGQFDQMVDASKALMQEYYTSASMLDPGIKRVNQKSINKFKDLFTDNAKLVDDMSETLLSNRRFSNYASRVLDYLPTEGVKFSMFSASIRDISYDEAGFYKVEVQTQKTVYNGIEPNNSAFECKTGRVYFLRFILFIEKDDLNEAKIFKISGEIKKHCEDASSSFNIHTRVGTDFANLSGFNNNKSVAPVNADYQDFSIDVQSPLVIGLGASYQLPITKKELLFLDIGASYTFFRLKTNSIGTYNFIDESSKNEVVFPQGNTTLDYTYYKYVRMDVQEKVNLHAIEFPVGLMYRKRFVTNDRLKIGIASWIVPTLHFLQSSETSVNELSYWANIDFEGANLGIDFQDDIANDDLMPYGIDEVEGFTGEPTLETSLAFSLRLAPYVQFAINDEKTTFIELGLEYTHGLTNHVLHQNTGNLFLRDEGDDLLGLEDEIGVSLLETHFEKSTISTLGARIGVVFQL